MATSHPPRLLSLSQQFYRLLLAAYPHGFRAEYGPLMLQLFRDDCRAALRSRGRAAVAHLWLATLGDWAQSALAQHLAPFGGPARLGEKLGLGLVAGLAGGAVAGLGARLAMRGVALAGGLAPAFTLEGTLFLIVLGVIVGLPFGLVYVALRPALPGRGAWKGIAYGVLLFAVFLAPPFLFYREGEATLASPLVTVLLFGPVALAYGAAVETVVGLTERRPLPRPTAPSPAWAGLGQVAWFLLFALVLEVAVLGTNSILNHLPRLPQGVVTLTQAVHAPFMLVRDANRLLVNLIALGYFGSSALIFWHRAAGRPARLAGLALFALGAGLFNTGAGYYARLMTDTAVLRPAFALLQAAGLTALLALLAVFPDGRFAPAWTRRLLLAWAGWVALWFGAASLAVPLPEPLVFAVAAGCLAAGVVAQRQRYLAASPEERARLRWPLRGFAAAVLGFSLVAGLLVLFPDLRLRGLSGLAAAATFSPYMLPWLFVPLSIAWAMRRHRLWAA
jgi:hypothetical protein